MKHQNGTSFCNSGMGELTRNGISISKMQKGKNTLSPHHLKDCYKVCLLSRNHLLHRTNDLAEMDGATLFIEHPCGSYFRGLFSQEQNGYACFFTENFLQTNACSKRLTKRLFFGGVREMMFSLTKEQSHFLVATFKKLIDEQDTSYIFKNELVHDYLDLIFHEALKMQRSAYIQNQ